MQVREATKIVRSWTTDSRRWASFKPRAGDIVVSTAAKCGTTWMIQIANLLVEQSPAPLPIWFLSPWLDVKDYPLEQLLGVLEAQTRRRVIKSHLPSDALPLYDGVRYIHVARDGRDAFLSWHNHMRGYNQQILDWSDASGLADETIGLPHPRAPEDPHEFFRTWMTEGPEARLADDMPAARYFDIERSFWRDRHLPNVLLVHYNDLKADLDGEMRRVAAFLGIPVKDDIWPALVEAAGFETMRANGKSLMPRGHFTWKDGHETFFNVGTNARWRSVLTESDIALYEDRVRRETSQPLAAWLAGGRLDAGDPVTAAD